MFLFVFYDARSFLVWQICYFIIDKDNGALNLVSMSSKPEMIFESGFDGYKISWAGEC